MIRYQETLEGVDWDALRADLIADDFHNGRNAEQYRRSFAQSEVVVLAFDDQRVIGTVRALSDGVCNAYIVDVWTQSAYRRRGIATTMMKRALARLTGQHICLWTDDAAAFYQTLGFERAPEILLERIVGEWLQSE